MAKQAKSIARDVASVADEMERNKLTSFTGTWRHMAVAAKALRNELFQQFETEFTRPPKLLIRDVGAEQPWREVSAEPGSKHRLKDMGCRVRIVKFDLINSRSAGGHA